MDAWKVVGYRPVVDKETGAVKGYRIFFAREPQDKLIVGLETAVEYINIKYVSYVPKENEMVRIYFNRWGKIENICPVEMQNA